MKLPENLTPLPHGALNRCFGCGERNAAGLRLRFLIDDQRQVVAPFRLARRFEGPPGLAHGGIIATLLDEAMSKTNRARGVVAMTRQLTIEYLRPVPLGTPLLLMGRHLGAKERENRCEAEIRTEDGKILARGNALFIAIGSVPAA